VSVRQRIVLVIAVLAVPIVVWQASTLAGRDVPAPAQPKIRTAGGGWVPLGGAISSGATLSGGRSPSGNITFKLYASLTDCNAGTTALFSDTVPVNSGNGWYPFYNTYAPTSVGTYYWIASYSGDSNNQAATGACISVEVKPPPPEATEEEATDEETTDEETTSLLEEGELAAPPDSTLSYGGNVVSVSVSASYCWSTAEGAMCADGVPTIPPRKQRLYVPSGSEMVFRYKAPRPPKKVSVSAASFDKKGPFGEPSGSPRSLKAHGSGVERTIPVELPRGEYGVYVYVTDPQGDPYYLFRVMVE
jgi:hypothetical protein